MILRMILSVCLSLAAECGGRIHAASSGRLLSPGYPAPYDNNLHCTWVVEADPGRTIRWVRARAPRPCCGEAAAGALPQPSGGRGRGRAVRGSPRLPRRRARTVLTGECERECDIGCARRRCCRARGPALRCLNSRVRVARPVSWAALSGQRAAGQTASHGRGGLGWAAGASPHGPLFFRPCWPVLSGGSGQTVQASAGVAAANGLPRWISGEVRFGDARSTFHRTRRKSH